MLSKANGKTKVIVFVFLGVIVVIALTVVIIKASLKNSSDSHFCEIIRSEFNNKYDMASYVAAIRTENSDAALIIPEGFDSFDSISIQPGNFYELKSELYNIHFRTFHEEQEAYIFEKDIERAEKMVEVDGTKYYYELRNIIFYVKDGYYHRIGVIAKDFDLDDFLNNHKLIKYEFVGNDIARGKVHEDKTLKYSFDNTQLELSYKYKEINYKMCVEYDVYTDGVNEYFFDNDDKFLGYRIYNSTGNVNSGNLLDIVKAEASKYVNMDVFTLEKETENSNSTAFLFYQYKSQNKTNRFVNVHVDKDGDITELLINDIEVDCEIPSIDNKLLEKEINRRLEKIHIQRGYTQKLNKIENLVYSIDPSDELVAICEVKANVVRSYKTNYTTDIDVFPMTMVIKINDLGKWNS